MKNKIGLLLITITLLVTGCKNANTVKESEEIKKITSQRDSVMEASAKKDSSINSLVSSFIEIENNLMDIKEKEGALSLHSKNNGELSNGVKEEINDNIKIINDLMDKNRQKITTLNTKLKDANLSIGILDQFISTLITQINYKNKELIMLNKALMATGRVTGVLSTVMVDFGLQSASKSDTIKQKNTELNKAYFIIGKLKDLKSKKIVDENGGFLGIGKEKKINPDFNKAFFKEIDNMETTFIPVAGKNIKIITPHPSSSYKLESKENNTAANLVIIEPALFWSESKFLVILIN